MATTYDDASEFRSSIDFDLVLDPPVNAQRAGSISDWPPNDIPKMGEDSDRISIAVDGFTQEDLGITFQSNPLVVTGKWQEACADEHLHPGLAGRPFEHRFELADHVRVNAADVGNGLLSIGLVREIPEALRPRKKQSKAHLVWRLWRKSKSKRQLDRRVQGRGAVITAPQALRVERRVR
jgi:molecular chaperone IbpA